MFIVPLPPPHSVRPFVGPSHQILFGPSKMQHGCASSGLLYLFLLTNYCNLLIVIITVYLLVNAVCLNKLELTEQAPCQLLSTVCLKFGLLNLG